MANPHDDALLKPLLKMERELYLSYFYEVHKKIRDDSNYWQILAAVWMATECTTPNLPFWRELFSVPRSRRHKLMKKKDRRTWRTLPATIVAYRAADPGEDLDAAISWSMDPDVCKRIGKGRFFHKRRFKRIDVIAYFNRRGEREIVVLKGAK